MPVTMEQILDARERRAARQQALLAEYKSCLLCYTMNIPGPVKDSELIWKAFRLGKRLLMAQLLREKLPLLHSQAERCDAGSNAFFCLAADPMRVKQIASELEDASPFGRLLDLDVLLPDGTKISREEIGLPERGCLLCGAPGRSCARSRRHPVDQLQARTEQILLEAVDDRDAEDAGELAVRALLYEVCTTPKPGLVDRENSGAHRDMDLFTFLNSCSALQPYFSECCRIGRRTAQKAPEETFAALRVPGKLAESHMLEATGGINTHKGAVFSLGLLCGAMGRLQSDHWSVPENILTTAAAMTRGLTAAELGSLSADAAVTAGEKLFVSHGITGIRGQAEAGFPLVREHGLPVLMQGLAMGKTPEEAGCAALMTMLAHGQDTAMIARSSPARAKELTDELQQLLLREPYPSRQTLAQLDAAFRAEGLSPGGSADLLAVCYLLWFLIEQENDWKRCEMTCLARGKAIQESIKRKARAEIS